MFHKRNATVVPFSGGDGGGRIFLAIVVLAVTPDHHGAFLRELKLGQWEIPPPGLHANTNLWCCIQSPPLFASPSPNPKNFVNADAAGAVHALLITTPLQQLESRIDPVDKNRRDLTETSRPCLDENSARRVGTSAGITCISLYTHACT